MRDEYLPHNSISPITYSKFIKQRTQNWHNMRKECKVTGSTLGRSIGLNTVKAQKEHFDRVINRVEPPSPNPQVQAAMQHGTENEIHAVGTLV